MHHICLLSIKKIAAMFRVRDVWFMLAHRLTEPK